MFNNIVSVDWVRLNEKLYKFGKLIDLLDQKF